MKIYVAKTLKDVNKYGETYDLTCQPEETVDVYIQEDYDESFLNHLVDPINNACNTLLDDGDYDFFNPDQCKRLNEVLNDYHCKSTSTQLAETIALLKKCAECAITYGTGLAIEL